MTGTSSNIQHGEGSSSSGQRISDRTLHDLDGVEAADLSLENELLADDLLDEHNGKAP